MQEHYDYKGQDLTMDITMKIEDIVHQIAEKERLPFDQCLEKFTTSRTYQNLQNTMTQLWAESAEYIVDEYYRDIQNYK